MKRRTCACTRCVKEAKPVVSSCMRCVVFVQLYEVSCMRYVVCVELYAVSCNKRFAPPSRHVFVILPLAACKPYQSVTHTHSLSRKHTHIARAGSLLALRRQLLVDYVLSRAKARGPEAVPEALLAWHASVETDHLFCYAVPAHHTPMLVFDILAGGDECRHDLLRLARTV